MARVSHHSDALERGDFSAGSLLLARIREFGTVAGADDHFRIPLAMALGNTLSYSDAPELERDSSHLVHELRLLAARKEPSSDLQALILNGLSERFAPKQ